MAEVAGFTNLPKSFTTEDVPQSLQRLEKPVQVEVQSILTRQENYAGRQFVQGLVIDPENAQGQKSRDRDDAIWVDEADRIVQISVADVAAYIKEGSALDQMAQLKGFTQYNAADAQDPMLPRVLSEGKLSLLQGKPRMTMTVSIRLDEAYDIAAVTIQPTWLVSPRDFSYKEAALARGDSQDAFHDQLTSADGVARKLRNRRIAKEESTKEQTGRRGDAATEIRMHQMIEEFMLLANKALAKFALENELPIVYRNHKLTAQVFGATGVGYYSDTCDGHEGLGFTEYLHATSPLRRYADLYVWRVIKRFLETGEIREKDAKRVPRVARRITWTERHRSA